MSNQPIRGQQYVFYVTLVSRSTGQFQVNPTIAAGDFQASKDGVTYANLATLPVVEPAGSESVKVTLSASEMSASNVNFRGKDVAGAEWDDVFANIQPISWITPNDIVNSNVVLWASGTIPTPNLTGIPKVDMIDIDGLATNGNNATLRLKKLEIINNAGDALVSYSSGGNGRGATFRGYGSGIGLEVVGGQTGNGMQIDGGGSGGSGLSIGSSGNLYTALAITATGAGSAGVYVYSDNGDGLSLDAAAGKSINAPQDIAVSDGNLTLTNIAKKVLTLDWTTVTGEAARSVLNALRKLRNKVSFNGTDTLTVYKEDGTTSAYTQSVTEDANQDPFKELGN